MDGGDASTLVIYGICQLFLITFLILWVQQLCWVVDFRDKSALLRATLIIIYILLSIMEIFIHMGITAIDSLAFENKNWMLYNIYRSVLLMRCLIMLQVFKAFINQWINNYVTDEGF